MGVQPGDDVVIGVGFLVRGQGSEDGQGFAQGLGPVALADGPAGLDAVELDGRLQDDAGQAHAADRRPEGVGVLAGRQLGGHAVRAEQCEPPDVPAE